MTFRCELRQPSSVEGIDGAVHLEEDLDHYQSLVMIACELLDQTDAEFRMSGFGLDPWGVNVSYDLSAVLEDLPGVQRFVQERKAGELELYPSGLERILAFVPTQDGWEITCLRQEGRVAYPETEQIGHEELETMLSELAAEFAASLRLIGPELADRFTRQAAAELP